MKGRSQIAENSNKISDEKVRDIMDERARAERLWDNGDISDEELAEILEKEREIIIKGSPSREEKTLDYQVKKWEKEMVFSEKDAWESCLTARYEKNHTCSLCEKYDKNEILDTIRSLEKKLWQ